MCSAHAERDVPFGRDVSFGSDVRFAREDAEPHHITLRLKGAKHHYGEAITSLRLAATSLFTNDQNYAITYIEGEVLLWLNLNSVNYQWNFP